MADGSIGIGGDVGAGADGDESLPGGDDARGEGDRGGVIHARHHRRASRQPGEAGSFLGHAADDLPGVIQPGEHAAGKVHLLQHLVIPLAGPGVIRRKEGGLRAIPGEDAR